MNPRPTNIADMADAIDEALDMLNIVAEVHGATGDVVIRLTVDHAARLLAILEDEVDR